MSAPLVDTWRWCSDRLLIHRRDWGSGQFRQISLRRRLARLTTKRYQSGEVDYDGHISRRGDAYLRGLLYEAATVILTRAHADSELRRWGLKLREKIGFTRAAIAVARKLSVIMHAMLKSGELFERSPATAA